MTRNRANSLAGPRGSVWPGSLHLTDLITVLAAQVPLNTRQPERSGCQSAEARSDPVPARLVPAVLLVPNQTCSGSARSRSECMLTLWVGRCGGSGSARCADPVFLPGRTPPQNRTLRAAFRTPQAPEPSRASAQTAVRFF